MDKVKKANSKAIEKWENHLLVKDLERIQISHDHAIIMTTNIASSQVEKSPLTLEGKKNLLT